MVDSRKRIAMVAYTIFRPDARVRRHVTALRNAGYEVDVYALKADDGVLDKNEDGLTFHLPRKRTKKSVGKFGVLVDYLMFTLACTFLLLRDHFQGQRFDLVHVNNMPNFLIAAALPLRVLGIPMLLDIHDTMPEIYQDKFEVGPGHWIIKTLFLEERFSMKLASYVMTTEHTKWERLLENGLSKGGSCVTLNLPDTDIFPEARLSPVETDSPDVFRLVYHGTLAQRLGMDLAVRAVDILRNRIPGVRMTIIGDGEQRQVLVDLVAELGLEEFVKLSDGFVPMDELPQLLKGSHLAIIPSRNRIGTRLMLPTKLLEYVQIGIPAITVATHTITRYFDESMVCFAESENPADLADKIQFLYENPQELTLLAKRARTFYQTYNFETERSKYLKVVKSLILGEQPNLTETGSR